MPFVEVISDSDPSVTAAELLADESSTALGARRLGSIAGDVGEVRYDGDEQKRSYLLAGDVREGASSGAALHLPQQPVAWPDSPAPLTVDIGPFDPSQWMSLRSYDVGLCSAFPGPATPDLFWNEIAAGFIAGLDGALASSLEGERKEPATFTPVLRTGNTYDAQGDRFRFSYNFAALRVDERLPWWPGGAVGCDDVDLRIAGELGWARRRGVISYPPQCLSESDPGHVIATDDGSTWDFVGVVVDLDVEAHSSGCVVLESIEEGVADQVRDGLPRAFGQAILDALLVDPNALGVSVEDIRPCTCDTECSDLSPEGPLPYAPGRRHRCKLTRGGPEPCGECWVQLDPDRLHARPEGLEIVLAEDETDPQASFLERTLPGAILCSPRRLSVPSSEPPLLGSLPGTLEIAPPGPPVPIEPTCRREEL